MHQRKCAAAAVLMAGSLVFGAAPAEARPDKPGTTAGSALAQVPPAQRERIVAQNKARAAATEIRSAIERTNPLGYTGIELYQGGVRLWFKGEPPAAVAKAVDNARRSVSVEVMPTAYSLAELKPASDRMLAYLRENPDGPAHRISIPVDGSGLTVGVDANAVDPLAGLPEVGVPVQAIGMNRVHRKGRYDDIPPFYGGAMINSVEGLRCTSGFAVRVGTSRYLLTAGHCGYPGQTWSNANNTRSIGTVSLEDVGQDLMLIRADSGGRIFTGSGTADNTASPVIGWAGVFTGEELCSSGARTTWLCGHVVKDAGNTSYCDTDPFGTRECYSGLILSEQEGGIPVAQEGDSGGPVVLPTDNGVIAKGTISASAVDELVWQDFATANQIWGVAPV